MSTNLHEFRSSHSPAGEGKVLLKEEVYNIVGAAFEVGNTLGFGLLEKPYENAMGVELAHRGISFQQQVPFEVTYRDTCVGEYTADLVAYNQIIVEIKAHKALTDTDRAQLLNYLRLSKLRVGLLINFGQPKVEWERLVL